MRWWVSWEVNIYPAFFCTLDMLTKMTSGCPWQPLQERGHAWLLSAWSWISNVFLVSERCLFVLLCSSAGDHVLWLLGVTAGSLTSLIHPLEFLHWIIRTLEYDPLTLCCCCCPSFLLCSTNAQNIIYIEYIKLQSSCFFLFRKQNLRATFNLEKYI